MGRKRKVTLHLLLILAVFYCFNFDNSLGASIQMKPLISENSKIVQKDKKILMIDWVTNNSECSTITAKEIVEAVLETSNPLLLLSIMKKESEFKPKAISSSSCIGLGQISPIHIKELKEENIINSRKDLTRIKNNIKSMDFILQQKLERANNNVRKALLYYVGDTSRKDYVNSVMKNYSSLHGYVAKGTHGKSKKSKK